MTALHTLGLTRLKLEGALPPSIRSLKYLLPNFVFPDVERRGGRIPNFMRENVPDFLLPWSVFAGGPPPESK